MQDFSIVPALAVGLLLFWLFVSIRTIKLGKLRRYYAIMIPIWLSLLACWGMYSKELAMTGVYDSKAFLDTMPMFWIPLVPIGITAVMMLLPSFRFAVVTIISSHQTAFIWLQALRILAIGTLIKMYMGVFPVSFAIAVAIPDMLFGLSAIVVARKSMRGTLSPKCLFKWNILGLLAVLPAAPVIGQMALPGAMYYFTSLPDGRALFDYPMVIAPSLVVPFFLIMNGFFLLRYRSEVKS